MKTCSKCKEVKEVSEFGKRKLSKDGLQTWCKSCNISNSKQWYKFNKEHKIDCTNQYRQYNPEYTKQYYQQVKSNDVQGVYLLFGGESDYDRELLYIGSSEQLLRRTKDHLYAHHSKKFIHDVNYIEWLECDDIRLMEELLIKALNPKYNVQHNINMKEVI